MTVSLVIPQAMADDLKAVAALSVETAGVMLTRIVEAPNGDLRILGRRMRWVAESAYSSRRWNGMSIRPEGYLNALAEAELAGDVCMWVHTHPGDDASPKSSDDDLLVDHQIADLFRLRSGSPFYGALIFSQSEGGLAFSGHLQREACPCSPIERLWQVGDRWCLTRAFDCALPALPNIFDRNVRAFGEAIQRTLGDLRVTVIGCGGTGSAVAEQLVRLGVRHLALMDPEELSDSNVTRVYGSTPADIGQPKVDVLARHLRAVAPSIHCEATSSMVTLQTAARGLTAADVIFGCTDDNAGRLVLSRIATFLMTPVIDCGVLLSSDVTGNLIGIDGRVTILSPGQACLVCRNRVDMARASSELLTPEERVRRVDEGYAPALAQVEPAVVAFTTLVGATAVSELLERLIGYGPEPRPSEVLLRCHEREISTNVSMPRSGHYCHPLTGKLGIGITEPFLEQIWPAQ